MCIDVPHPPFSKIITKGLNSVLSLVCDTFRVVENQVEIIALKVRNTIECLKNSIECRLFCNISYTNVMKF